MSGNPNLRPAAFFDRDGVLNVDTGYAHDPAKAAWVPGAAEAVKRCNRAGYWVFVVTNQSGVGRGFYDEAAVARFHAHMVDAFLEKGATIDAFRYCPHHPDAQITDYKKDCNWRKPAPGMLLDLFDKWPIDKARSFMIGDKQTDLLAAQAAGIRGYLFDPDDDDLDALVGAALGDAKTQGGGD